MKTPAEDRGTVHLMRGARAFLAVLLWCLFRPGYIDKTKQLKRVHLRLLWRFAKTHLLNAQKDWMPV